MPLNISKLAGFLVLALLAYPASSQAESRRLADFRGNRDCVQLENKTTRVTLGSRGGRVLEYALNSVNALYLPDGDKGMSAGRFDIGPEQTIPKHPNLWSGEWKVETTGPLSAKLTSVKDKPTGVQLTRTFQLAPNSSQLVCTQTIHNVSDRKVQYCHWSRTFAVGGGIVILPTSKVSRFPNHYVMYSPAPLINYRPQDPKILVESDHIQIVGAPAHPKLGFDSQAGWMAYLAPNDLLFVKHFKVSPNRVYNEVAGLTASVWYPDGPMCELEPIGPQEDLAPGKSAAFTETWSLAPMKFPAGRANYEKVRTMAEALGKTKQ